MRDGQRQNPGAVCAAATGERLAVRFGSDQLPIGTVEDE
jgi:hypothetical protein